MTKYGLILACVSMICFTLCIAAVAMVDAKKAEQKQKTAQPCVNTP